MPLFHCQTLEGYECGGASNFTFRGFHQKRKVDMGLENQLEDFELEQRVNFPKRPCPWPTQGTPQNFCRESGNHQQRPSLCSPHDIQHENCVVGCDQSQHQSFNQHVVQSLALSQESFNNACHHRETNNMLCGASNDHKEYHKGNQSGNQQDTLVTVPSSNSLPRNMGSNNLAQHFMSRIQWRNQEAEEERIQNGSNNNNVHYKPDSLVENMDQGDEEMSELEQQNYADSSPFHNDIKQDTQRETLCQAMEPSTTEMDSDTAHYLTGNIPVSSPQNIEYGETPRRCPSLSCSGLKPSPVSGRLHCHCSASWRGMYGIDSGYGTDYY